MTSPASTPSSTLQGLVASHDDERALLDALEKAFDYRGDVTISLSPAASAAAGAGRAGGSTVPVTITGYIFDRRIGTTLADSYLRIMRADTGEKVRIAYGDIERIEFTGRDAAHGRSFETWVKQYVEKKLKGEKASIESEKLE